MIVSAIGNAIATGTTVLGARYFAMFLMPMGAISACEHSGQLASILEYLLTGFYQIKLLSHGSPTLSLDL
jgi:hypothetical protein